MKNYGVLKATALDYKRDSDSSPHSELLLENSGEKFRVAINVRSSRGPEYKRLIEYVIKHDFKHPVLDQAKTLPRGWNDLTDGKNDGAALDYIRSNLFRASELKPVPHLAPGPNNDLFEYVESLLQRAIKEKSAMVYAFGERWGPDGGSDIYFNFSPKNGVHMIHMNQGESSGSHGTYRDGAELARGGYGLPLPPGTDRSRHGQPSGR